MVRAIRFAGAMAALLFAARGLVAGEPEWSAPLAVARVLSGERLQLEDGRTVRLAGIRVPGASSDERQSGDDADPSGAAAEARTVLLHLLAGQAVRLGLAAARNDRYGELAAQVERADGLWLQGALLERGLVEVQTRPGEVERAAPMLEREHAARAAGRGLWADPALAPRSADRLAGTVGSFQIVQGRVRRVAATDDFIYLNFGPDWRRDFTLRIRRADLDDGFTGSGIDVLALEGRRIEVRGLVLEAGGPLIELSHAEQIEVLP
jgi:endonuclease YncB( thermonuclease family)